MIFCLTTSPSQLSANSVWSRCSKKYRTLLNASAPFSSRSSKFPGLCGLASCVLRSAFRVSRFSCQNSSFRLWLSGYWPHSIERRHLRYSSTENAPRTTQQGPYRLKSLLSFCSASSNRFPALSRKQSAKYKIDFGSTSDDKGLAMPLMRFVLFAVVLPLQFPPLNFSTRNRHDFRCQALESFEWRFALWLGLGTFHEENCTAQDLERKVADSSSRNAVSFS